MAWRHLEQNEETPLMVILYQSKQLCEKSELKSKKWKTELNSAKGFSAINASKLQLLGGMLKTLPVLEYGGRGGRSDLEAECDRRNGERERRTMERDEGGWSLISFLRHSACWRWCFTTATSIPTATPYPVIPHSPTLSFLVTKWNKTHFPFPIRCENGILVSRFSLSICVLASPVRYSRIGV